MLDASPRAGIVAQAAPRLPVATLVVGRPVDEVSALLPRLFNLCRAAQGAAVEAALGRAVETEGIAKEILRDHLIKLHVTWPAFFGAAPSTLPSDWAEGGAALLRAVFGRACAAPATASDFLAFLDADEGAAPILRKIAGCFGPGEACAEGLAPLNADQIWEPGRADNSVAARRADHPAMDGLAERFGRGPLWRAAGRLYDIAAVAAGDLPPVLTPRPGEAIVPAARGSYAVRIETDGDLVTGLDRVTPTDHLLADGAVLDRSLATLPSHKAGLGPLLLDILDPCSPVRLREVGHA